MKVKSAVLRAYYDLDETYIEFPENPLHGRVYNDVDVEFDEVTRKICGIDFVFDVIKIEGEEPIECELLDYYYSNGALIIELCQDWG